MENSTGTYPRARDPQNRVQEDERGAPTARPPDPPSEAAHDGAVTNPICNRTIVCGLRACAPECALTVPAWRVHPLQCMYEYTYIYSPVIYISQRARARAQQLYGTLSVPTWAL